MNTTLKFLGAGSAFSFANGQNNIIIEVETALKTEKMLVDCGTQWQYMILGELYKSEVEELIDSGLTYRAAVATINLRIATGEIAETESIGRLVGFLHSVDSIFITHNHADHNGALEMIGFLTRFIPPLKPIKLYGMSICLQELWDNCLKAGMGCLNYGQMTESERKKSVDLESYFEPVYLTGEPEDAIKMGSTIIEPFTTMHVSNRLKQVDSCGLLITTLSGKEIMFTSDTQHCPQQLPDMYEVADVVFHDFETTEHPSGVHAHMNQLREYSAEIKKKIKPCHYNDGFKRSLAEEYGFDTPVEMGDSFTFV